MILNKQGHKTSPNRDIKRKHNKRVKEQSHTTHPEFKEYKSFEVNFVFDQDILTSADSVLNPGF